MEIGLGCISVDLEVEDRLEVCLLALLVPEKLEMLAEDKNEPTAATEYGFCGGLAGTGGWSEAEALIWATRFLTEDFLCFRPGMRGGKEMSRGSSTDQFVE